ncbi:MAG: bifunctional demethylmenaquinone methyltransferase/2-methoxy-6-polyprenyl-1,4-benzoquinol methylase UbiE [Vicinamibacteria bacterium]
MPEASTVRRMFAGVAPRYDLLNHLLSLGIDRRWRRDVVSGLNLKPSDRVLDLCCGTGDLALELAPHARCLACDFTWEMLTRAKAKSTRTGQTLRLAAADALRLPFPADQFDAATVGFGVRNLEDLPAGLREFRRVLRPQGSLVILEFSQPTRPLLRLPYQIYLNGLLPLIGRVVSKRKEAYRYLAESIAGFPNPETLSDILAAERFRNINYRRLTGGIVAIHTATA